jgi:Apea-like HEPN
MPIRPDRKIDFIKKIRAITQQITDVHSPHERRRRYLQYEGVSFELVNESVENYDLLVKEFLEKFKWSAKYTEASVEIKVRKLVTKVIIGESDETIGNILQEMVDTYEAINEKVRVFLPVAGIQVTQAITFGGVIFKSNSPELKQEIITLAKKSINATSSTRTEKKAVLKMMIKRFEHMFKQPTIAEYEVIAENTRAEELSITRLRRILDVIRVSIPILYRSDLRIQVGLGDEVVFSSLTVASFSSQLGGSLNETRLGPYVAFQLNKETISEMESQGFIHTLILDQLESKLNQVEIAYLQGIHWLSNAQIQVEPENKILSLVTCLETFFSSDKSNIANTVAESIALLLASDFDSRKKSKKRIKELYDVRSKISHGSESAVSNLDLIDITIIAYSIMKHIYDNLSKYQTLDNIRDEVERLKLS